MIKTNITVIAILSGVVMLVVGEPKPDQEKTQVEPTAIEAILRKVKAGKCNRVIILPMIIDEKLDPSDETKATAPDYTIVSQREVAIFFELLDKRNACDGLPLGHQYEVIFLMDECPTTPGMSLMFRKAGESWYFASLEEKYEMSEDFSKWINARMVTVIQNK